MSVQGHERMATHEDIRPTNRISSNSKRALVVIGVFAAVTGIKIMTILKDSVSPPKERYAAASRKGQEIDTAEHTELAEPFEIRKDECITTDPCTLRFLDNGLVLQVNENICYIERVTIRNVLDITLGDRQIATNLPDGITDVIPCGDVWVLQTGKHSLMFSNADIERLANDLRRESSSSYEAHLPYTVFIHEENLLSQVANREGSCELEFLIKKVKPTQYVDTKIATSLK